MLSNIPQSIDSVLRTTHEDYDDYYYFVESGQPHY